MVAKYLPAAVRQEDAFDGRVRTVINFGRAHAEGKCQQELLHLELVEAVLVYQLVLYLQRIHLLDALRQFADAGDAVQVHQAYHLGKHAREVEVYHQQVATEHAVGNVGILQHATQSLNHHHAFCHFRRRFRQGIHLVHRGHGKLDTALLQLQIRRAPSVQQRIHRGETTTDIEARQRCFGMPEGNGEVGTVLRLCFQVEDVDSIQKGFQTFGHFHFLARNVLQQMQNQLCRITKVFAGETQFLLLARNKRTVLPGSSADNAHFLRFDIVTARTVMLFPLYQGNGPAQGFVFFSFRCAQ